MKVRKKGTGYRGTFTVIVRKTEIMGRYRPKTTSYTSTPCPFPAMPMAIGNEVLAVTGPYTCLGIAISGPVCREKGGVPLPFELVPV
jgi:hypothetical protein